ncbi:MAG: diadenylate cyclase CdaA [Lachnospiraceae bacterium]|nr:diadenylate cyclase CdaA [Lachnospiraceae bacterium]
MQVIKEYLKDYLTILANDITFVGILEIIIIAFIVYQLMRWIKNTRAWSSLKGLVVLIVFMLIAKILKMNTILWLAEKTYSVGIIALVIIFQPELRKALEQIGQNKVLKSFPLGESSKYGDNALELKDIDEIVSACSAMSRAKTGALIVLEKETPLNEFIQTGINIDGVVSSALLLNIFEHNTPLHDGAVIMRGKRVVSATCYLPLSDSLGISKELGTRHRAALGMSETTDSVTIVVSEETGDISLAHNGRLLRGVSAAQLKEKLIELTEIAEESKKVNIKLWRGKAKNDKDAKK